MGETLYLSHPLGNYDRPPYQIEEHQIGEVLIYVPIKSTDSRTEVIQKANTLLPEVLADQTKAIAYAIANNLELSKTPPKDLCIFAIRFSDNLDSVEYEINLDPAEFDCDLIEPIFVERNAVGQFSNNPPKE